MEMQETVLVEEIREIISAGHDVTVESDDDYEMAGDFLNELKDKEKSAREWFAPMVKAAYTAHKEVKVRENDIIKPLVKARKALGAVMGLYQTKKEMEREKLRIQQQREADEKALDEAVKLEEAARIDKIARLEEAARLKEAGNLREAVMIEAAAKSEEATRLEAAEVALESAPVMQPTIEPTVVKVEGTSVRTTWGYEIVDESIIPREFLCVDEKYIGITVRARKGSTSIPGVRVYSTINVS